MAWKARQLSGRLDNGLEGTTTAWKARQRSGRFGNGLEGSATVWQAPQLSRRLGNSLVGSATVWKARQRSGRHDSGRSSWPTTDAFQSSKSSLSFSGSVRVISAYIHSYPRQTQCIL